MIPRKYNQKQSYRRNADAALTLREGGGAGRCHAKVLKYVKTTEELILIGEIRTSETW